MKLPCRGKYFFRNLWSSRIALRFTVSEWIQSRDWLSSSPGSCGLGKGEGASGTIRMFAAALIPTLEHGFSVAWFQIETKFYFGNHWMENRDFHVTIVQWKSLSRSLHLPHSFPGLYVALKFSINHQQLTQNPILLTKFVSHPPLSSYKVLIAAYKPAILLQFSGEISHKV